MLSSLYLLWIDALIVPFLRIFSIDALLSTHTSKISYHGALMCLWCSSLWPYTLVAQGLDTIVEGLRASGLIHLVPWRQRLCMQIIIFGVELDELILSLALLSCSNSPRITDNRGVPRLGEQWPFIIPQLIYSYLFCWCIECTITPYPSFVHATSRSITTSYKFFHGD